MLSDAQKLADYKQGLLDEELADRWECAPLGVRSWRLRQGLPKNGEVKRPVIMPVVKNTPHTICATIVPLHVEQKKPAVKKRRWRELSLLEEDSLLSLATWLKLAAKIKGTTNYQRVTAAIDCARYELSGRT